MSAARGEYAGRQVNPAVAGSSNYPEDATAERGQVILEIIVERVADRAQALLEETASGDP